ncbi:hypothetical protein BH23PSE1_BH23PSE1_00210 [soil metagenome]
MAKSSGKPIPEESKVAKPYWDAARRGELQIQRCASCGLHRHYPQLVCPQCHSLEVAWVRAGGNGHLHSWTIAHHAFHPAFADEVPYVLATVELEEGPRVLCRLEGIEAEALRPGLPLAGSFRSDAAGRPVLTFGPACAPARASGERRE